MKTACLPDAQLPDGMECKISGWGATEECKATFAYSASILKLSFLHTDRWVCFRGKWGLNVC